MLTAGFLIPPGQHLIVAFQKEDFIIDLHPAQFLQALEQIVEHLAAPHVHHHRHAGKPVLRLEAELRKLRQKLRRHIIHAVKADILQRGDRPGLSRARTGRSQ